MKSFIAFLGSPRKNGMTAQVMDKVIAGAKEDSAEVISYYLNDDSIRGCQGCRWCKTHEGCILNDGIAGLYEQLKEADGIIIGSPIYFMNITSQTKKIMDRLYPVRKADGGSNLPGKKFVSVYTQGNPDKEMFRNIIDANDRVLKSFQWEMIDSILYYGTGNPDERVTEEVMRRAFEAGRKLAGRWASHVSENNI